MKKLCIIPALILCLVILVPCFPASAEETKYHRSGIYTYTILNEQEKQISICEIASQDKKITIPSELDGYQVYALGYESHFHNDDSVIKEIGGGAKETLEELEIPSSVKYVYVFAREVFLNVAAGRISCCRKIPPAKMVLFHII